MLPFMKQRRIAGLIVSQRKPDGKIDAPSHMEGEENQALEACAEDMIRAMTAKDVKALASAIRSAFECLEAEPHSEGGEDYDSLNAKAAQEAQE